MAPMAWRKPPGSRPAAMICRTARASIVRPGDLEGSLPACRSGLDARKLFPVFRRSWRLPMTEPWHELKPRFRRYYRGTRCHRVPSVAVRETADGAHRPFQGTKPVRHASVDTATQRSAATQGDTGRDRERRTASHENPQPAGRFRRWWQVLGSNQRRLCRRFYRPLAMQARSERHRPRNCRLSSADLFANPQVVPGMVCIEPRWGRYTNHHHYGPVLLPVGPVPARLPSRPGWCGRPRRSSRRSG
jgi:hypothetical protein